MKPVFSLVGRWNIAIFALFLVLMFVMFACDAQPPSPESDNDVAFSVGSRLEADPTIYTITGRVVNPASSYSELVPSAQVQLAPGNVAVYANTFTQEGKGMVLIHVHGTEPPSEFAEPESTVILKVTDRKGMVLLPGYLVSFRCRLEQEAVAPIVQGETVSAAHITHEWDYCRLFSPVIGLPTVENSDIEKVLP